MFEELDKLIETSDVTSEDKAILSDATNNRIFAPNRFEDELDYTKVFSDVIDFINYKTKNTNFIDCFFDGIASRGQNIFLLTKHLNMEDNFRDHIKEVKENITVGENNRDTRLKGIVQNSKSITSLRLVKRGMYNKSIPVYIFANAANDEKFIIEINTIKFLSEIGFRFISKIIYSNVNNKLYFVFEKDGFTLFVMGYFIPPANEASVLSAKKLLEKLNTIL